MTESHHGSGLVLNSQCFLCSIQSSGITSMPLPQRRTFLDYFDIGSILLNPHCALDKDVIAVSRWGTHKCQVGWAVHSILYSYSTPKSPRGGFWHF